MASASWSFSVAASVAAPGGEQIHVDKFPAIGQHLREQRNRARAVERTALSNSRTEPVERRDDRFSAMRALDRGDLPHDATAPARSCEVHDDVDRRCDLVADV